LTFDYTQPLSYIREQYLVNYLDSQAVAGLLKTKALITANFLSLPGAAKEANKECKDIYKSYHDLILPTSVKSDIIKDMSKEERIKLGDKLRAATANAKKPISSPKPKKLKA
jgi:hypothetical protein